jgi:hypothetical protein
LKIMDETPNTVQNIEKKLNIWNQWKIPQWKINFICNYEPEFETNNPRWD